MVFKNIHVNLLQVNTVTMDYLKNNERKKQEFAFFPFANQVKSESDHSSFNFIWAILN